MISRSQAGLEVVHAFDLKQFTSCTVSGFTSACGTVDTGGALPFSFAGRIIDRLGLRRNYNAVVPIISAHGTVNSSVESTALFNYQAIAVGVQHASATGGTWADYSTEFWQAERPLVRVSTATSTADSFYSAEAAFISPNTAALMSSAASSSTSTGYSAYVSGPVGAIPISGAKRYLRMLVAPSINCTGCGGPVVNVMGSLLFGAPDAAPAATDIRARIHVSSACSS